MKFPLVKSNKPNGFSINRNKRKHEIQKIEGHFLPDILAKQAFSDLVFRKPNPQTNPEKRIEHPRDVNRNRNPDLRWAKKRN